MEMSTPSVNSVGVNPNGHEPVASAPIAMTHAAGPAGNGARSLTTRPVVSPMGGVPALPPASSARADHDEITRRRDEHGNRLGWVFWHSIPTASDVPLLESYVEHAIAVVEEAGLVGCAHNLRFFYEQKLRGAIQRLKQVHEEEHVRLNEANAHAVEQNSRIADGQAELETARDAATASDTAAILALDRPLIEAHGVAAERCAGVGGTYDPASPSEACVLRHAPKPLEVLAAQLALPWVDADSHTHLPGWVRSGATVLIGIMMGLSLAIIAGIVSAGNLWRNPAGLALFAFIGCAAAWLGAGAVKHAYKYATERYYLGHSAGSWAPFAGIAGVLSAAIVVIDCVVEREGLLKIARAHEMALSLSGGQQQGGGSNWVYLIAAVLVTFGYVAYYAWEGYAYGRRHVVHDRLLAEQERQFSIEDQARRSDPDVRTALGTIARVNEIRRQQAALETRIARTAAPWEAKIDALKALQRPVNNEIDDEAKRRIQDARDNLHGTQAEFDQRLDDALIHVEGPGGWSRSLWRRLWGYRPRRPRIKEPRKGGR